MYFRKEPLSESPAHQTWSSESGGASPGRAAEPAQNLRRAPLGPPEPAAPQPGAPWRPGASEKPRPRRPGSELRRVGPKGFINYCSLVYRPARRTSLPGSSLFWDTGGSFSRAAPSPGAAPPRQRAAMQPRRGAGLGDILRQSPGGGPPAKMQHEEAGITWRHVKQHPVQSPCFRQPERQPDEEYTLAQSHRYGAPVTEDWVYTFQLLRVRHLTSQLARHSEGSQQAGQLACPLASPSASQPACLPARLPACLPACLPASQPARPPAREHAPAA